MGKLKLLKPILIACLCLKFSSDCFADKKVPLVIIHARGQYDMSTIEVYEMLNFVKERYKEHGIAFRLKRFIEMPDPKPQVGFNYFNYADQIFWWEWYLGTKRIGRRHWLMLVVAPPSPSIGRLWFGGVAIRQCARGRPRVAYQNAGPVNASGLPRKLVSWTIAQHEIAHLLGAGHDESSINVMNAAPLGYVAFPDSSPLSWGLAAFPEIRECNLFKNGVSNDEGCYLASN